MNNLIWSYSIGYDLPPNTDQKNVIAILIHRSCYRFAIDGPL